MAKKTTTGTDTATTEPNKWGMFLVPLYNIYVYVFIGETDEEFVRKTAGVTKYEAPIVGTGQTYTEDGLKIVVTLPDDDGHISLETIGHEAYHVVGCIGRTVDLTYTHESHEALAYLAGYVVNEIGRIARAAGFKPHVERQQPFPLT